MALSSEVSPEESLGRYLTASGHFARTKNEVKFTAFIPPSDKRLSVCRLDGLKLDDIWDMGQNKVILTMKRPRRLYGVADIKAGVVEGVELKTDPDPVPCRHADIVGWPEEEAKQLSIAQKLAAEANLTLKQ